jgi:serine/threonine-protein kinase HipA
VTKEVEQGVQVPGNPPEGAVAPVAEAILTRASVAALKVLKA